MRLGTSVTSALNLLHPIRHQDSALCHTISNKLKCFDFETLFSLQSAKLLLKSDEVVVCGNVSCKRI